jgi:tight adherence protein C
MQIIVIGVFVSVFCLALVFLHYIFANQIAISSRLHDIGVFHSPQIQEGVDEELQIDFLNRILKPLFNKMSVITQRYTPVRKRDFVEKKLEYAGKPFGWDSANFLSAQYGTATGIAVLTLIICLSAGSGLGKTLAAAFIALLLGYLLVDILLTAAIKRRHKEIERELPDLLDLLTISIEAGLGFDAAVQRVVQKSKGPLSGEFNQALQEMRMGKTRREALKDLGERNGVVDLIKFLQAIVQADQLGVSLGNVLRTQSDQMRVLRRQRVEEKAMKAPVKMLIPLVLFIFPTIFIVILAPAVIQIMATM